MEDEDEGDLVCVAYSEKDDIASLDDFEDPLQDAAKYLAGKAMCNKSSSKRATIQRRAVKHMWRKGRLYWK